MTILPNEKGMSDLNDPDGSTNEPLSVRRRLLFSIIIIVLTLIAAVLVLEFVLSWWNPLGLKERASWHYLLWEGIRPSANPEMVWEHVPDYAGKLTGYSVRINSLGLRGEELSKVKPHMGVRILALGDSMTFGMSGEQEDCYPAQLQKLLRSRFPVRPTEVANAGILGYTTLQEEAILKQLYPGLRPDIVILFWFHNDVVLTGRASKLSQQEQMRTLLGFKTRNTKTKLVHACYEIVPCLTALVRTCYVGFGERDNTYFQFDPRSSPAGWMANAASLRRIISYLQTAGTPLILYSFSNYREIEEIAKDTNTTYIFSLSKAGRAEEERYAVSNYDSHFTREGNSVVARTIFDVLVPTFYGQSGKGQAVSK